MQPVVGHTTTTITLDTYVDWPDAIDQTRTLVDSELRCTASYPPAVDAA